jgi:hypothetical protein
VSSFEADTTSNQGWGAGRYRAGGYGVDEESITIVPTDGKQYDALSFAKNVVDGWDAFFTKHQMI